jgi:hypothetical protein
MRNRFHYQRLRHLWANRRLNSPGIRPRCVRRGVSVQRFLQRQYVLRQASGAFLGLRQFDHVPGQVQTAVPHMRRGRSHMGLHSWLGPHSEQVPLHSASRWHHTNYRCIVFEQFRVRERRLPYGSNWPQPFGRPRHDRRDHGDALRGRPSERGGRRRQIERQQRRREQRMWHLCKRGRRPRKLLIEEA